MRSHHWISALIRKATVAALVFSLAGASIAFVDRGGDSRAEAQSPAKVEATIFSYDGQDFVRTTTTLAIEDGKSAVGSKLDRGTPAFAALMQKRSYTGDATVFGHNYVANYAPLTGSDGKLTGALFVAVAK